VARIQVKLQPKASENRITGYDGDALRVRVTAAPENGKANEALVSLLSECLGLPKSRIVLLRGHTARTKLLEFEGTDMEELLSLLSAVGHHHR
jgi:uncharacterized protein